MDATDFDVSEHTYRPNVCGRVIDQWTGDVFCPGVGRLFEPGKLFVFVLFSWSWVDGVIVFGSASAEDYLCGIIREGYFFESLREACQAFGR